MPSAWLLPEHVCDVLPTEARRIEEIRRALLDVARGYGCELVMPPLLEHLESLLTGTGRELDLKTFKLVDQLSGRTLGVRADTTPQVARIDAHLLNRQGVTRLCYCGPVLHTRPAGLRATREPLQFGVEVYGHAGLEAELEVLELSVDALQCVGVEGLVVDLGDARILRGVLAGSGADDACAAALHSALAAKDATEVSELARSLSQAARVALQAMLRLYGGDEVIAAAREALPQQPAVTAALDDLAWLAKHLRLAYPRLTVGFDLADLGGYAYYSGVRFAIYAGATSDALARGGRYDEVGAVFGRTRPAVGFSMDLKELAELAPRRELPAAVRAPWSEDAGLRAAVRQLRQQGEVVVCMLPGHGHEVQEFDCDRELVSVAHEWVVRAL